MFNEDHLLDVESATSSVISFKNDKHTIRNVVQASRSIFGRLRSLLSRVRYEKKFAWRHLSLATKIIFALAATSTLSAYPTLAMTCDHLHLLTSLKDLGYSPHPVGSP